MPNRASFLVDGFNVYHSVRDALRRFGGSLKWLDLAGLCRAYLYLFGRDTQLEGVYYFSALASHLMQRNPGVVARHETYIDALEWSGVDVALGRFKPKDVRCDHCKQPMRRHEEKETDVAIAAKLFELLVRDATDTVVLVTGDTDLVPAIRSAKALFRSKQICVLFPYGRSNAELKQIAHSSFKIKPSQYGQYQLPNRITLADGRILHKPATW